MLTASSFGMGAEEKNPDFTLRTITIARIREQGYYQPGFFGPGKSMYARLTVLRFLTAFLLLSACGPTLRPPSVSSDLLRQESALQREVTYKLIVERKIRLQRVYTPLRLANADICGSNVSPVTGMTGIDRHTLDPELRPIAERVHGLTDGIKIIDILPGSPAAEAGLLSDDVIVGATKGAGTMPTGWSWSALTIPDLVKVIEASQDEPITLLVRRVGNTFPLVLRPRSGCRYPIELKIDQTMNAAADGSRIIVNTGTFNYVQNDHQLAFLVGHELAHNILEHVQKKEGNAAVGTVAGLLVDIGLAAMRINSGGLGMRTGADAGAKAYSKEFESEADYLGLYLLARAGFDITAAQELFRRMGAEKPSDQAQLYFSTHPSTPERAAAMQETVAEIATKTGLREALLPATLAGQALALRSIDQKINDPVVAAVQAQTPIQQVKAPPPLTQPARSFTSPSTAGPPTVVPQAESPPLRASLESRSLAQLFLVKGPIVSNPPQTFDAEFLPSGKAQVILSGRRLLTGEYEMFGLSESIKAKYKPNLINPDSLKPFAGADAKGFATFSDAAVRLECVYAIAKSGRQGEGLCADNQSNQYRIVFD